MAYEPNFAIGGDDSSVVQPPAFLIPGSGNGSDTGRSGGGDSGEPDGFDPAIHVGRDKRNADGSYTRKRGRRGSGDGTTRKTKASHSASIEGLTRILAIMHIGIATATKTPEMKLEDDEAALLAASTANVLEQFDIKPDPKIEAIVGLVTTAGMIYGPRVYMIGQRKKEEREERETSNVYGAGA